MGLNFVHQFPTQTISLILFSNKIKEKIQKPTLQQKSFIVPFILSLD